MQLLDYLDPNCVAVNLEARDKESTLRRLVAMAVESGVVHDADALLAALRQREDVVSTGIGNGVAIPHADLPEIESPRLGLATIPGGVDFEALDEEPVFVVFLLLGTPRTPGLHMKILARIARLSKHEEFSVGLREAATTDQALDILRLVEAKD